MNNFKFADGESPFGIVSPFDKKSRDKWQQLRRGTPLENQIPTCGAFVNEFYGEKKSEGIDLKALVKFIRNNRTDKSLSFDYTTYQKPDSYTYFDTGTNIDITKIVNAVPFSYKDENKIVRQTIISGKLNKRNCYLEDGYGYQLKINPSEKIIKATLRFYYENTKQYRNDFTETLKTNDFTIDGKYVAISLSTHNLNDFVHLIKEIQGENSFKNIKKMLVKKYAELLNNNNNGSEVTFLYKNAPHFILRELHKNINKETFFKHLDALIKYDTKGVFSGWIDNSSAIINLFAAIGNAKYLFDKFKENPKLVKDIYWNLDGNSVVQVNFDKKATEITKRNRTIFSEFILALCYHNKHYKALKTKENTFYIGDNYKFDSNVLRINDAEKDKIFIKQLVGHTETKTIIIGDDMPKFNERFEIEETIYSPENEGVYFEPLDLVFLIDADAKNNIPLPVPAIYLKSISDEEEWKGINQSIRIGADILAIVLGVATLGAASPLLLAIAAIDIGVATTDILVAVSEDALMKTPEGREFLENWNKVSLGLGIVTAGPLMINAFRKTFTIGARLLAKATLKSTQSFLRTAMLKLILEINIANFTKNTLRIIPYEEVRIVTRNILSSTASTKLQKIGVIFVEGEIQVAKQSEKGIALIYKGEVIASGTAKEVKKAVKEFTNLRGEELLSKLDEIIESVQMGVKRALKRKGKVVANFTRGTSFEILTKQGKSLFGGNYFDLKRKATVVVTGIVKDVQVIKNTSKNGVYVWKTGINNGGMDILSSPKWFEIQNQFSKLYEVNSSLFWKKVTDEFWKQVNKPWLDAIIKRGDDVRFVSNPNSDKSKFIFDSRIRDFIKGANGDKVSTIFSREIKYLLENGYIIKGKKAIKIKK